MNVSLNVSGKDVSVNVPKISVGIEPKEISVDLSVPKKEVEIKTPKKSVEIGVQRIREMVSDHSQLDNLDYEHSGHTGFASKEMLDEVEAKIPTIPENIVIDEDYVHTDNNFTDEYKEKLDNESGSAESISYDDNYGYGVDNVQDALDKVYGIFDNMPSFDTSGDGSKYLGDDAEYHNIPSGGSGDLQIPDIRIQLKTNNDYERLLYLEFGKATQNFLNYVENNGVEIHLFKYIRQGKKIWGTEEDERGVREKRNVKKWVHPLNHYEPVHPNEQCWGIRSFQRFEQYEGQIDDIIADADYAIPNDGIVQSEYILTYKDFKQGYKIIKLNDIMACIIKKTERSNEQVDDMIPYDGDGANVRIIGCRMSSRRARQRQPIKFVFAIRPNGKLVYGNSNVALLELFKYRLVDEEGNPWEKGYTGTGILPDIGYGVLIK